MKLRVSDLIVFEREIEVPDECPHCGADLEDVGLYHWEFQDQRRSVDVVKDKEGNLHIEWDDCLPKSGEGDLAVSWQCGKCDCTLVEAQSYVDHGPMSELKMVVAKVIGWQI